MIKDVPTIICDYCGERQACKNHEDLNNKFENLHFVEIKVIVSRDSHACMDCAGHVLQILNDYMHNVHVKDGLSKEGAT